MATANSYASALSSAIDELIVSPDRMVSLRLTYEVPANSIYAAELTSTLSEFIPRYP
jgi:hypothetical protein